MKNDFLAGVGAALLAMSFLISIVALSYSIGKTAGREELWREGEARGFVERKGWNEQYVWKTPKEKGGGQ